MYEAEGVEHSGEKTKTGEFSPTKLGIHQPDEMSVISVNYLNLNLYYKLFNTNTFLFRRQIQALQLQRHQARRSQTTQKRLKRHHKLNSYNPNISLVKTYSNN